MLYKKVYRYLCGTVFSQAAEGQLSPAMQCNVKICVLLVLKLGPVNYKCCFRTVMIVVYSISLQKTARLYLEKKLPNSIQRNQWVEMITIFPPIMDTLRKIVIPKENRHTITFSFGVSIFLGAIFIAQQLMGFLLVSSSFSRQK